MKTLTQFKSESGLPENLVSAVVRQLGGWAEFKRSAPDIASHGIDGGFCGFVYYADTCKFYRENAPAIRAVLRSMADDFGQSVAGMVAGFRCLANVSVQEVESFFMGDLADDDTRTTIENALAWFAAEEVANQWENATAWA